MTADALDLLELLAAIADDPNPLAERNRRRIIGAMIADAEAHGDEVNPNRVRALLSNEHGLDVNPRMLSAMYSRLRAQGVLRHDGWTTSTDVRGGNAGKPARTWRWVAAT